MVEAGRQKNHAWTKSVVDYVVNRQNEDGGYTFCQGAESNTQDTYYGLSILKLLNEPFPNSEKTKSWLGTVDLDSIYSSYYVTKAVLLLGEELGEKLKEITASVIKLERYLGSRDVFPEVSSEFTTVYMALELADLLSLDFDRDKLAKWLLSFQNGDGGFGFNKRSSINATYYAIASLSMLERDVKGLPEAASYVRKCEKPSGGFTVIPISYMPYVEYTYYGVMALDLLGEDCRHPIQTVNFLLNCRNRNGGFARSDLGISTFENTFQAVSILQKLRL